MSNLLCSSTCGVAGQPPATYADLCDGNQFRKYGFPFFGLAKCDFTLPDPTDIAAWQTAIDAGDVVLSPRGKMDISIDTETDPDVNICAGETVVSTTYSLTFSTYQAVKFQDCRYFAQLLKQHLNYRIFWFTCEGCVYMPSEYVDFVYETNNAGTPVAPSASPGFEFTISSPPTETEGTGKKIVWTFTAEIELNGSDIICYTEIPGLFEALQA